MRPLAGQERERKKAEFCVKCLDGQNIQDFKNEFARRSEEMKNPCCLRLWYMDWRFPDAVSAAFICLSCGDRREQHRFGVSDPNGWIVPATVCCTNPDCKVAKAFWGSGVQLADARLEVRPRPSCSDDVGANHSA